MFRKSMGDLVRGIRANKNDESKYINKCLQDIKEELKLVNKKAKTIAIQKLTYVRPSSPPPYPPPPGPLTARGSRVRAIGQKEGVRERELRWVVAGKNQAERG